MKTPFAVFFISLILFACNGNIDLNQSEKIKATFSSTEIDDLTAIHTFFTREIIQLTENQNPTSAYSTFLEDMEATSTLGTYPYTIQTTKIDSLVHQLDSNFVSTIWTKVSYSSEDGSPTENLDLLPQSKYIEYLGLIGTENATVKNYHDNIISSGHLNATAVATFIYEWKSFDVTNSDIQLMIAIHYITVQYYKT